MKAGNPYVRAEQAVVEKFVRREYWRMAALKTGRFAFTRSPLRARKETPSD